MRVRVPGVGVHTMSERSYHGATSRSQRNKETTNNELNTNRLWPRCRRTTRESLGPWCWCAHNERTLLPRSYVSLPHTEIKKPPITNYTLTDHGLGVEEQHVRVWVPGVGVHTMSERSYHGATSRSLTKK